MQSATYTCRCYRIYKCVYVGICTMGNFDQVGSFRASCYYYSASVLARYPICSLNFATRTHNKTPPYTQLLCGVFTL